MLTKIAFGFRLYHTIKFLKFKQIWYRIRYAIYRAKPVISDVGEPRDWRWDGVNIHQKSILGKNEFRFLNKSGFVKSKKDWNSPNYSKLWLYNLHYFDDLNATDYEQRINLHLELMKVWIDDNPPLFGNGWEPYTISLRIVNWVKWLSKREKIDNRIISSLTLQADSLSKQLEFHILGNHLFANAKALVFVGTYLKGAQAEKFLALGLKLLDQEIETQFLKDGAHFELSPMYHGILLWDLLELINLAKTSKELSLLDRVKDWKVIAGKGLDWMRFMCHPDGEISFFNDSAFGVAPSPDQIISYCSLLGIQGRTVGSKLLTQSASGYSRVEFSEYMALIDHAPIGPNYLPGHGHADALSFEMSIRQERFIVNSGTSVYGVSPERLRQRKTKAHNTVTVREADSSEVWSGFRVARRANCQLNSIRKESESIELVASHDGFKLLEKGLVHQRKFNFDANRMSIVDSLNLKEPATAHFHFAPRVKLSRQSEDSVVAIIGKQTKVVLRFSGEIKIMNSTWHPEFGKSIPNQKIEASFQEGKHHFSIEIIKEYN